MQKEHCEKNNFITTAPVILDKISCYQQFTKNKFAFSKTGLASTISKKKTFTFREKITKPAITEQQQMLLKSIKKKHTHTHTLLDSKAENTSPTQSSSRIQQF